MERAEEMTPEELIEALNDTIVGGGHIFHHERARAIIESARAAAHASGKLEGAKEERARILTLLKEAGMDRGAKAVMGVLVGAIESLPLTVETKAATESPAAPPPERR